MRVFVAGATGVLGRRLVERLADGGHDVTGLTRDATGDATVESRGATAVRGDVTDEAVAAAVGDADCVVHAATAVPTGKASASDWERDAEVRREGARHLASAAAECGARYVGQSVTWVARPDGGGRFDEDSPRNPTRATQGSADAERLAREHHPNPVILRGGWFYGPESAHTRQFGEQLLAGRLPALGTGFLGRESATLSYCHTVDAARAFAAAVEGDATGTYHVVDDRPAPFGDFVRAFAAELDAPTPRRLPGWILRPVLGTDAVGMLTTDAVTGNDRFREAFDWEPLYPTHEAGLEQVVERWRADGVVVPTDGGWQWNDGGE
ncbi:NAD-dependent epimerase/dehydratase family protein [Halobacterium litoreum]|uniref:NAD-dependent epimerase/dehydratase family protein n=1 Tax=Halobacterium litoreum TaxID=2039234 RepID=A0ABD5NGX8_9EURY|nr:NAD(P)-dependent oxidoreductase [Halobacterium litoreum]UHH12875.1 NAD(P)-dependent oxidoreductase [Halobacterium litoreum]